jgi:hypothetical protein
MKHKNAAQKHSNGNVEARTAVCYAIRHSPVHHPASILVRKLSSPYTHSHSVHTHIKQQIQKIQIP